MYSLTIVARLMSVRLQSFFPECENSCFSKIVLSIVIPVFVFLGKNITIHTFETDSIFESFDFSSLDNPSPHERVHSTEQQLVDDGGDLLEI